MLSEGEGKTKKYGAEHRRQWRKLHLGIDTETLSIRAIEVSSNRLGDAQVLPDLLKAMSSSTRPVGAEPMIQSKVTLQLPNEMPKRLSPYARMVNLGKPPG